MNIYDEVLQAEKRIRPHILKTPLLKSRELGKIIEGNVYLKLESEQYTGSFKARGSLNKLMSLSEDQLTRGTVTASTGNHALGYSRALEILNAKGTIYLPENASKAKTKALSNYKVELQRHGTDSLATELFAKKKAIVKRGKINNNSPIFSFSGDEKILSIDCSNSMLGSSSNFCIK